MGKTILSEGVEQGAELEANIFKCFDRLSGPLADVSPTKDQKGCGVGLGISVASLSTVIILVTSIRSLISVAWHLA